MRSEISETQKDQHCDSTHTRPQEESNSEREEAQGTEVWGEGWGVKCFMGTEFPFGKNVLEINSGDGYTAVYTRTQCH